MRIKLYQSGGEQSLNGYSIKEGVLTIDPTKFKEGITGSEKKLLIQKAFQDYEVQGGNPKAVTNSKGMRVNPDNAFLLVTSDKAKEVTNAKVEDKPLIKPTTNDKTNNGPIPKKEVKESPVDINNVEEPKQWITNYDSKYHYINEGGRWFAKKSSNPDSPLFELPKGSLAEAKLEEFMKSRKWDDKSMGATVALEGGKSNEVDYSDRYGASNGKWSKPYQLGDIVSRIYKLGGKING
jgi:hypothetical protein